jgi:hypothetical protein
MKIFLAECKMKSQQKDNKINSHTVHFDSNRQQSYSLLVNRRHLAFIIPATIVNSIVNSLYDLPLRKNAESIPVILIAPLVIQSNIILEVSELLKVRKSLIELNYMIYALNENNKRNDIDVRYYLDNDFLKESLRNEMLLYEHNTNYMKKTLTSRHKKL